MPGPIAVPQTLQPQPSAAKPTPEPMGVHPIVWRVPFPEVVSASLVSWKNPPVRSPTVTLNWQAACYTTHAWLSSITPGRGPPLLR